MISKVLLGVLIPFIGTTLGAANVFFMKENISLKTERMLQGFAAGVMIAASVWSLIIPACCGMPICDMKTGNGNSTNSTDRPDG